MSHQPADATTEVVLDLGEKAEKGQVFVAIYESEADFKDEKILYGTSQKVAGESELTIEIPALSPAVYGIAVYYDKNGNDKLDSNAFGIPKEPYGFAGEPASKWRRPKWEEISTQLGDQERELRITLKRWKDR
ncbi:MAG: DUF2141 domain-containing protein [Bacteroidota bacterium]